MTVVPFKKMPFHRATTDLRAAIADVIPPGGKMSFGTLCQPRPRLGHDLLMGYAESLSNAAHEVFGEPAAVHYPNITVRHNSAEASDFHPWHTDSMFFRPLRGLTFWVTFDDVGTTAPSLEFETESDIVSPIVSAGTALMFGSDVRHRTQPIAGPRVSIEFRCVPLSARTGPWLLERQAIVEDRDGASVLAIYKGDQLIGSAPVERAGHDYTT